ncbi:MAG: Polyribonucleotide nucleotidyltransferase, partial [candidate division CPR2 bacterium GW2011_GWC1_39_9]
MQASGAVMLKYGDTVLMATAVVSDKVRADIDYFPLMVDFEEKHYAAGKISGSRFIKREGRPSETAILTSRLIDRPVRPLFPKGYKNDIQVIVTALSFDKENDPDYLGIIAASAALSLSGAPFMGPISGIRVGLIEDTLVLNPTITEMENSKLDLIISGTKDGIIMVEAGASEVTEEKMIKALELGHQGMKPVIELQEKMAKEIGVKPKEYELFTVSKDAISAVEKFLVGKLGEDIRHSDEIQREGAIADLESQVFGDLQDDYEA